ncbi:MAG: hypothetical protein ACP5OG_03525 [Candidatus Nanoarchaeia archaeon]
MDVEITSKSLKFILAFFVFLLALSFISIVNAVPEGPSLVNITSNTTKATNNATNISTVPGGYIAKINITANLKNTRWKGFVGWVTGKFSLMDVDGSTIFDWSLSSTNGKIYATRAPETIEWGTINCSNLSRMEIENTLINHTNVDDNITATFFNSSHPEFSVGTKTIPANNCSSLNTYIENATGATAEFYEMVLDDGDDIVYATILENNQLGYNSLNYDFQMIVPENGASSFSGITPYYLYVEIN